MGCTLQTDHNWKRIRTSGWQTTTYGARRQVTLRCEHCKATKVLYSQHTRLEGVKK